MRWLFQELIHESDRLVVKELFGAYLLFQELIHESDRLGGKAVVIGDTVVSGAHSRI